MARLIGPLHSDEAHGTIRKQTTYQRGKRSAFARSYCFPGSKRRTAATAAQLQIRACTKTLMQAWPTIDPSYRDTWTDLAEAQQITPISAYLRENYRRRAQGLSFTDIYPEPDGIQIYTGGTTYLDASLMTATFAEDGQLHVFLNGAWADADLTEFETTNHPETTGRWEFRNFAQLAGIQIAVSNCLQTPILENLLALATLSLGTSHTPTAIDLSPAPNLVNFSQDVAEMTVAPRFNANPKLKYVMLDTNDYPDVDQVFLDVNTTPPGNPAGRLIAVDGGTSAPPTAASAAKRAALLAANWQLRFNT